MFFGSHLRKKNECDFVIECVCLVGVSSYISPVVIIVVIKHHHESQFHHAIINGFQVAYDYSCYEKAKIR